jgi:hypothetical protein
MLSKSHCSKYRVSKNRYSKETATNTTKPVVELNDLTKMMWNIA